MEQADVNFGVTSRLIATAFGLCGFAVAIIAGLGAGNSASRVLATALVCMIVCQVTGLAAGAVGERVINEHLDAYRKKNPLPIFGEEAGAEQSSPPNEQNS
jgi:hypothetical protein